MNSWTMILLIFSFTASFFDTGLCQNGTSASGDVNQYGIYYHCPDGTYYADVPGITIHCEPIPWIESKHEICWRDLWWKAYANVDPRQVGISDPFNVLDANGCRAKCFCKLTVDLGKFECLDKGASLGWNRYPPAYTKYKPVFHCTQFTLPSLFNTLAKDSVELAIAINIPVPSINPQTDASSYATLTQSIFQSGYPIGGWVINTTAPIADDASLSLVQPLLYNISFNDTVHRLEIINQYLDPRSNTTKLFQVPNLDSVLSTFPRSLELLRLEGLSIATIADASKPLFLTSLKTILVKNSFNFTRMPTWIGNAANLVFLKLDNVASAFSWDSLGTLSSLKFFALVNTQISNLPSQLNLAKTFPQLEYLDLSNLNLVTIPTNFATGMSSLKFLDISGNQLSTLPSFAGLSQLEYLGVAGRASKVNSLDCAYGPTRKIAINKSDLADLSNLIALDMSNYDNITLGDDAVVPCPSLRVFKASCAGLTQVPAALRYACRLRELRLASNQLNAPDSIPSFLITELVELSILDLRNNSISTVSQNILSFPNTSRQLIDWLEISIRKNPVYSSACETNRFVTAYGLPPMYRLGNSSVSDQQQCSANSITTAVATARACQPVQRRPVILLANGFMKKASTIVIVIGVIISNF